MNEINSEIDQILSCMVENKCNLNLEFKIIEVCKKIAQFCKDDESHEQVNGILAKVVMMYKLLSQPR